MNDHPADRAPSGAPLTPETRAPLPLGPSLLAILPASVGAIVAFWMAVPWTALALGDRFGLSPAAVGLFAALPWAALIAGSLVLPRVVGQLCPARAVLLGIGLSAVAFATFLLSDQFALWVVASLLLGLGVGLEWIVTDAWMVAVAPERSRGRVLGAYQVLATGAMGAGPALLLLTGTGGTVPLLAALAILGLAALWLVLARPLARGLVPDIASEERSHGALGRAFRAMPLVLAAAFVGGVLEASNASLLPLWGAALGVAAVASLSAVAAAGGVASQFPLGALADRLSVWALLGGLAALVLVGLTLMPLAGAGAALLGVMALWARAVNGLYTAATVLVGRRVAAKDTAGAVTAVALMYTAGGLVGPWLAGLGLQWGGTAGLPMALAVPTAGLLLAVLLASRRAGTAPPPSAVASTVGPTPG